MASNPVRDRSLAGNLVAAIPDSGTFTLTGEEGRHSVSVRRVRVGEDLMITDGRGAWATGRVVSVTGRDTVELEILERGWEAPGSPAVTVVQALPKGDRGPLAVELLTEVGVERIVPWQASRCVSRWTDRNRGASGQASKADKGQQRWQRVACEAAKQSRRVWVPEVTPLADTATAAQLCQEAALALVCHEMADEPLPDVLDEVFGGSASAAGGAGAIVIVVGPEGSLTEEETEELVAAGGRLAGMGPTVMRTSSAGAVASAVVMARSGRWHQTSPPTMRPYGS